MLTVRGCYCRKSVLRYNVTCGCRQDAPLGGPVRSAEGVVRSTIKNRRRNLLFRRHLLFN